MLSPHLFRIAHKWRSAGQHLRSEEHTSELQSLRHLVCRLLLEKKKKQKHSHHKHSARADALTGLAATGANRRYAIRARSRSIARAQLTTTKMNTRTTYRGRGHD